MPTTILYVDNSFTFGGAINALAHLLSTLDRDRFHPVVLSAQDQSVLDRHFPGIPAYHWPMKMVWAEPGRRRRPGRRASGRPVQRVLSWARALRWVLQNDLPAALRIARFARRHGVDVVHLNNGVTGMLPALLAGKLLRIPVVGHYRAPERTTGAASLYARAVEQWIAVSETMARKLRAAGVKESRLKVVHDAIDLAAFAPGAADPGLRQTLGIAPAAPVFGIFGRIIPWKGIREFVEAAAPVLEALPEARALVVGDASDGTEDYFRDVRQLVAELGCAERLVFTGFRDDVGELMRLCDVVVHASLIPEPFGMTVIEAMATGTPVVAANSGGPTEILDHGETGLLVDPRDATALSGAILSLLRDPAAARAMGEKAAARAREQYGATRYARDVEEVYESLERSSSSR